MSVKSTLKNKAVTSVSQQDKNLKQQLRKCNQLVQCENLFNINTYLRDLEAGKPPPTYTLLYVGLSLSSYVFGTIKRQTLKQDIGACMGKAEHV